MANKRQLKKYISATCGALATECILAIEYVDGIDTAAMEQLIVDIAALQAHAVSRCSISYDKTPSDFDDLHSYTLARNAYFASAFRRLVKEFNEKTAEIVKAMNALLPDAQREANKAAAQS